MSPPTKKAWSGRFAKAAHYLTEHFGASIAFDHRLVHQDVAGSRAHIKMLASIGVVTADERDKILTALDEIEQEIASGHMEFSVIKEDIHLHIEARLIEKLGSTGGKLHTGRSRNDQVALDLRLYACESIDQTLRDLRALQRGLVAWADKHQDVIMPGYTHLQRAQPVLLVHHILAYVEMLARDCERLLDARRRTALSPLGSGALAGSTIPLDRQQVAVELGFPGITANSMDSVSDRDFALEILAVLAILMMHLSRLSEELILWSSQEFGFITFPDEWCTGSSMMPQKKNPDIPELVRGKTGRVYGDLMALLTVMKGLPLAYNKDMQEDKEPFFDAVDTVHHCLVILSVMIPTLRVNRQACLEATQAGFLAATDLADYLVGKDMPFRTAHEIVSRLVKDAVTQKRTLKDFTVTELQGYAAVIGPDVHGVLDIKQVVEKRKTAGGTASAVVLQQLELWQKRLAVV